MALTRTKRELESGVSLSWQRIQSGQYLNASRRKARESLEAEAQAITREFENGLRPYQDVEQAEADLQGAILQEIDAKYETLYQTLVLLTLTNRLEYPSEQN